MSFQAYLDAIEDKTGLTPRQLVDIAETKGFSGGNVKAAEVLEWLKTDYAIGGGHGMADVGRLTHERSETRSPIPPAQRC